MKILGIETSCDETGAAVIVANPKSSFVHMLSNIFPSSMAMHAKTGGIIPEIAAREQVRYIIPVIDLAFKEAGIKNPRTELDAIAVTYGPGLIGSLLVGVETAKTLSLVYDKPLIPVNHLFGHMYANWIKDKEQKEEIPFPLLALIISGGHTDLVLMKNHRAVTWLGGTRDDAAGEALDKIGRLLGLSYPGGAAIEEKARSGDAKRFRFPRPILYEKGYDFSFSGLKTAVLNEVKKHEALSEKLICDIAAGAQEAVCDVLITKTLKAANAYNVSSIILSGGVASNQTIRSKFMNIIEYKKLLIKFYVPDKNLCTDNAAMIATAGFFNRNYVSWEKVHANPQLYFD